MAYSLNALYKAAGISKQAVHQHIHREEAELGLVRQLIPRVDHRRTERPAEGLESLYWQLQPDGMGRDKFCRIFGQLGYGVAPPRRRIRTTIPAHKVFDNLIEGQVVDGPRQVWQSDITYIKIGDRFYYLTFIIDVYTRQIVGYATSRSLRADANRAALQMAIESFTGDQLNKCVHHSDRGTQYTDRQYLRMLRSAGMRVSMGGRATDNAFAERINGVVKNEYLCPRSLDSYRQLTRYTRDAVSDYNTKRHHGALERRSPDQYEQHYWQLPADRRKVEMIRSENTPPIRDSCLQELGIDAGRDNPYCMIYTN